MSIPRLLLQLFNEEPETEVQEVVEETEVAEVDQPTTEAEEYDIIDYNKEEVKIPVSERKTYLQKGYNYDKVTEKASKLEQELESLKSSSELNFINDFVKEQGFNTFSEYQEALEIQKLGKEQGLTPEIAKEVLEGRRAKAEQEKVQQTETQKKEVEEAVQQQVARFTEKFPDVDLKNLPDEVKDMYSKGTDLDIAYELHTLRNNKTKIEQDTIRKLQENSASSVGSVTKGNTDHNTSYATMSKSDFEAQVARVKRGEA